MSEAKTDAPKKKSKLPIILALALVLGGGGFFMMKGKGKEKEKPKIALAEKETELEEFLTNLANPTVYVRAKIVVRLTKDYKEDTFKNAMGDVRDAVLGVFNGASPELINDSKRRPELKKLLAEAMNTALEGPIEDEPKDKKHAEDDVPKRKGKETELPDKPDKKNDDWDSVTGPVLQVRFAALATQ